MMQQKQSERLVERTVKQIQKPNIQMNFQKKETVTKTDNFERELRKPRSKKRMKLLQSVDLPSMTDEEIMERMAREGGDDFEVENITSEDICAYLARCEAEFIETVQKEMVKEEEERKRQEEERKRQEDRVLRSCLSRCFIKGCEVHSLKGSGGWNGVTHYKKGCIPEEYKEAYRLYKESAHCNCVEIYNNRLVAIANNGEVIKIVEKTED